VEPVRVAQVGVGGIGGYHRGIVHALDDYVFVAAAERYPDKQQSHIEQLDEWGVPVYGDIWSMLDDVQVDAVILAVPHHFHGEYTIGCLQRGLHVMCEKPLTVLVQDGRKVVELARSRGLQAGVDFQYTGYPHSAKLKQLIMSGDLGRLQQIVGVVAWKRLDEYYARSHWAGKQYVEDRACFDGVLMNQAVHLVNSALQMGTRQDDHAAPQSMQAEMYRVHEGLQVEDLTCLRADLGEATLHFYATTCNMEDPEITTLEIIGSKGVASWDTDKAVVRLKGRDEQIVFDEPTDRNAIHTNFIECIRGEAHRLHAPADRALKATLTIDGAYSSAGQIKKISWDEASDIKALILRACSRRKLFSEMGTPWAFEGQPIDMKDYSEFNGL